MKILSFIASLVIGSPAIANDASIETVAHVDLERYMGRWYEIASFPQSFQKGCTATTADYSLQPNGKVKVVNTCRLNSLDGKTKVAHGTARVVDDSTNAKLKVTFFWPFSGDYWILDLGQDYFYDYAMVGAPNRDYLWFLSRKPQVDAATYAHLVERAKALGFDVSRLKITLQRQD